MSNIYKAKNYTVLLGITLCISIFPLINSSKVFAQVNINSKTSENDSQFYELSDTEVIVEEKIVTVDGDVIDSDQATINNDILRVFSFVDQNGNTTNLFNEASKFIVSNPAIPDLVKNFVANNGVAATASVAVMLSFLPLLISILPFLFTPQLLFVLLGSLFGEKKNILGIIYDKETKKPLPFTVVRLYNSGSNSLITQKVSDLEGRYGFILSVGKYRIEVDQSNYLKFTKEINIEKDEELFGEDIALVKNKEFNFFGIFKSAFDSIRKFTLKYSIYLSIVGFLFSLISLYFKRGLVDILLVGFYIAIISLYIFVTLRRRRQWAIIKDSTTGLRISGAIVRLFDRKNSLSDTQLTDENGRFAFYIDPGEYYLYVQATGFNFPSARQTDMPRDEKNLGLLKVVNEKSSWLNKTIYIDKVALKGAVASSMISNAGTNDKKSRLPLVSGTTTLNQNPPKPATPFDQQLGLNSLNYQGGSSMASPFS